jgi:hypothetical protein
MIEHTCNLSPRQPRTREKTHTPELSWGSEGSPHQTSPRVQRPGFARGELHRLTGPPSCALGPPGYCQGQGPRARRASNWSPFRPHPPPWQSKLLPQTVPTSPGLNSDPQSLSPITRPAIRAQNVATFAPHRLKGTAAKEQGPRTGGAAPTFRKRHKLAL